MNLILTRMKDMARALAQQFLSAAVWRVVWSLPLRTLLLVGIIVFVALAVFGCGHLTWNLKAHEEAHCREWGIPKERWIYEYGTPSATARACREATGLLFAEACAVRYLAGACVIYLPSRTL